MKMSHFLQEFVFKSEPRHYLYPSRKFSVSLEIITAPDESDSDSNCFDHKNVFGWPGGIRDKRRSQRMTYVVSNHFENSERVKPKNHCISTRLLHPCSHFDFEKNQQTRHFSSMLLH